MDRLECKISKISLGVMTFILLYISSFFFPFTSQARITTRVSVASDGTQANEDSHFPSISADGRYVAFVSGASNLTPGTIKGTYHIFVHDRLNGQTTQVSVASDGTQGHGVSLNPSISLDGRYVAFDSAAANLVPGDTNNRKDIFVHDRQTGQTTRVSVASDGSQGIDNSYSPSISGDGRFVAFTSTAANLVPGDKNSGSDIFVHDRQTGQTTLVSVASDGTQGNNDSWDPSISGDGRFVAFTSFASNLVPGDTSGRYDIFVHDRQTGQTTLVSVASDGSQANDSSYGSSISADGRYVVFQSSATNFVPANTKNGLDIFVHDRQTGQTTLVSVASDGTQANGYSWSPAISANGRYVVFKSYAANLVPGDTNGQEDIFAYDRQTGKTTRVSVASDGTQANGYSWSPAISANGRYVAFGSHATNLVPGDTNGKMDVFIYDSGLSTDAATNVTPHTATLNGTVNPQGLETTYSFVWGKTTAYGNTTPSISAGSGISNVVVSASLTGLASNTTYHYCLVTNNSMGTTYGSDGIFATPSTNFDFNGNGKADIFWRHVNSGENVIWFMNGTSIDYVRFSGAVGDLNWAVNGFGDFNGDGKTDILWQHAVSGKVFIWLMDGYSIIGLGQPATAGDQNWDIKGVGDFNGDGKADILWRHVSSGEVYVWLMNGTSLTGHGSLGSVATSWEIQGIGDFSGDGKADILWRHAAGMVYLWSMDGLSVIGQGSSANVDDLNWQIHKVGDFNGDGKADVLWRHSSLGTLFIWLMDGTTISGQGSPGTVDPNWAIKGVGDFNGDGKADILWRHNATGEVYIWLINGISLFAGNSPGAVGDTNWTISAP
ncbi:MAG: FG-GAP repeat protein [Deltaproteobacteria bacterium]|nr:FG-GAP repeat protein [Deltaproteobacteria bacterium]